MSEAGSIVWPSAGEPLWAMTWDLGDYPTQEGISIRSARYRGNQVFNKASMPSLRVQYDGPCGPYKDPLTWDNARSTTRCPGSRVCAYSYTSGGQRALAIESFHRIGAYRLTHRWVFWDSGWVSARLYSAGLQCNYNHRHHAYWRFDFDIDDAGRDQLLEHNTNSPDTGWGPGWHATSVETTRRKNPSTQRSWAVVDTSSLRGYHILPGANDGTADAFSTSDVWALLYHGTEDRNGSQGSAAADDLGGYVNGESIAAQDVVLWYCGHLSHHAAHGGDEWHAVGPNLAPFGPW